LDAFVPAVLAGASNEPRESVALSESSAAGCGADDSGDAVEFADGGSWLAAGISFLTGVICPTDADV